MEEGVKRDHSTALLRHGGRLLLHSHHRSEELRADANRSEERGEKIAGEPAEQHALFSSKLPTLCNSVALPSPIPPQLSSLSSSVLSRDHPLLLFLMTRSILPLPSRPCPVQAGGEAEGLAMPALIAHTSEHQLPPSVRPSLPPPSSTPLPPLPLPLQPCRAVEENSSDN